MSRRIEWSRRATEDLLDIPDPEVAADVAAAVRVFALAGYGAVIRFPNPDGPDDVRLYVPPHRYYVAIRFSDTVLYVERVLRSP